ncbi:hypothetical protein ACTXT7_014071 [Hymenolepis weldensis]
MQENSPLIGWEDLCMQVRDCSIAMQKTSTHFEPGMLSEHVEWEIVLVLACTRFERRGNSGTKQESALERFLSASWRSRY